MKKATMIILCFLISAEVVNAKTISIYHTSDVHGWYSARPAKWDKENSTRTIGGFAALSSLLKAEKNPYILLDSGDMFQGTPEGNFTKGMASIIIMNQLGYTAALVGNHDYDYTEENLKTLVSSASFPVLGANVYVKATGKNVDYLKPYAIIEKAGERIAVLGIAGVHTSHSTLPANVAHLTFADEPAETARWMEEIRKQKPDAVIVLAHIGIGDFGGRKIDLSTVTLTDEETAYGTIPVARAAKNAAVVIGGHNHTGLLKGYFDKPSSTLVAESYWGLTDFTKVDLDFDDATGKFKGAKAELIPLWTDKTGEDAEVLKTVSSLSAEVNKEMDKVVSKTAVDLSFSQEGLDSPIGNWMTDAMRRQSGTDLAFQNSPGIRAGFTKGSITMRDIYQVMPFENTLVTLTMTGAQLSELFLDNLHHGKSYLQVSGLTVKFHEGPDGKTTGLRLEQSGKEIKPEDKFSVVTNNYMTTGGSGGKVFLKTGNMQDTMRPVREALVKDLKENPVTALPAGGRITKF
ncbi:MAG: bifunctional UDP-sugar hydrolase/5'-nucleotidase [Elusimicrobia bacterium]|nr:bifunctional UDP-sugar hydrolase/5'-nucleotidase [Elusimicrobiota bacterium]